MLQLVVIYWCYINLLRADISETEKPDDWFAPVEAKDSSRRVTF